MGETEGQAQEPQAQPSRRLAAIMFTDLVGYSAMAHRDEALAIELLELHRAWVREILPRYGGHEIETIGDAFLIEFSGALAAVECAIALQQRFAAHNRAEPEARHMKLRVGIHVGDIEHRAGKVMGDGVNIASRIHGMAEPGGICVSEDVHRAVRNRRGLRFTSLGTPQLKNIATPLELFHLHAGPGSRRAALVAGVQRRIGRVPRWLAVGLALGALIAVFGDKEDGVKIERRDEAPAIAVLPFENLSAEPDSAFFTDGLHDTVIGHLSRVSGLKVISRTSVMGYRGKEKNLRRIGRELGADHILEGSVQRSGGRLRVAAQLIDSDTDTHLWSQEYDRDLKDVFAVQADIAQSVATAVHAKLTPQEQAGITSVPTSSPAAYDLYLRALQVERRADAKPAQIYEAIGWLDQAVALDPKFARAYALRARLNDLAYWHGYDPTEARRARVEKDADAALAIDPGLADAHIAKALFHYHGSRNYTAALAELEIARGLAPGNANVHFWIGPIYRRQGRWDEALASLDRAAVLDPLNTSFLVDRGGTLQMMRRYDEAAAVFARLETLEPDNPLIPAISAYHHFFATGDLTRLEQAVAKLPDGPDPGCQAIGLRIGLAILQRRFEEANRVGAACKEKFLPTSGGTQVPIEFYEAQVKWLADRKPSPQAAAARDIMEKMLAARPDLPELRMQLAFTLAMLGERRRAIEEADRALAGMPLSRDALTGAELRRAAVEVYANAGAEERAIAELEQLMRLPNGGHIHGVRLDPMLDPLRGNPRFEKLIADHLPKGQA